MWNSRYSQTIRYDILSDNLKKHDGSICDVGCGFGDFFHYLNSKNSFLRYTGIDISANMIVLAQKAYPLGNFRCLYLADILINNTFDYVVASGIFNLHMIDHENSILNTIKQMIQCANSSIRFNILTNKFKHSSSDSNIIYADIDALYKKLRPLVRSIDVITGYLPHDVTFYLEK